MGGSENNIAKKAYGWKLNRMFVCKVYLFQRWIVLFAVVAFRQRTLPVYSFTRPLQMLSLMVLYCAQYVAIGLVKSL